jgi:predicted amidohydrolase
MARTQKMALAANIFVQLTNGTRRIMSVVYNSSGDTIAQYAKHHLFMSEEDVFEPGPFQPTTFALQGKRFALLICYEGLYPILHHDWSQLEAFKAAGANAVLWSVGADLPVYLVGKDDARKAQAAVIGSQTKSGGVAVSATDHKLVGTVKPLPRIPGYRAKASVELVEL